ncbi:MAG: hypothetical protein ACI4HI_12000 [Lachnospiraceae bacterium]
MEKSKEFTTFLEIEIQTCEKKEQDLIAQNRKDEANLCKIEANIYQIFGILYQTALKQSQKDGANETDAETFFLEKAKSVPKNWKISYDAATEHQDAKKILIESTKLETAKHIMEVYQNLSEVNAG